MTFFLKKIIIDICKELNIKYKFISDEYITILEKNKKIVYLNEYLFGLNSEVSSLLCDDKFAMYEVLKEFKIPIIEYKLIWHPGNTKEDIDNKINEIKKYYKEHHNHLVIKPNLGNSGINVYQIKNEKEIESIFKDLLSKTNSICINPFYNIKNEYRVLMLNNEVRFIYKKELTNSWQFNLSKGSLAVKEIDDELKNKIIDLAMKTNKILKTKFVTIDIIQDINNNLYVLEVNSRVTMAKYIEQHIEDYEVVKNIYKDAIEELFKDN